MTLKIISTVNNAFILFYFVKHEQIIHKASSSYPCFFVVEPEPGLISYKAKWILLDGGFITVIRKKLLQDGMLFLMSNSDIHRRSRAASIFFLFIETPSL